MLKTNSNKIIYSLRVNIALQQQGFKPILTMDSPYKSGFFCWVYENTPEFKRALEGILGGAGK